MPLTIGIVVGEHSGDTLGAGFMRSVRARVSDVHFVGVGGPQMMAEGLERLYPMEPLSNVGLLEVLDNLSELLRIRRGLFRHFTHARPDVFVGIDCPDFNLVLEERLHRKGIPTVHYVSPTVWAWRSYRVHRIKRAVDLMLTVFPFEADFYREWQVPVRFVGHPLADMMPLEPDQAQARQTFGFEPGDEVIALLPGSRQSELRKLAGLFVDTVRWLHARRPGLRFIAPMASTETRALFEQALGEDAGRLHIRVIDGRAREAMVAADAVLAASGTATLEALLAKRPVVVTYRIKKFTWWLMRRLVRVQNLSLPNLLAGRTVVDEWIQSEARPENIGPSLLRYFESPETRRQSHDLFVGIHDSLRQNASEQAAEAVLELVNDRRADAA